MNIIVLLFFSFIFFQVNCQLDSHHSSLSKLQGELISNVEPEEIKSMKSTVISEKQTELKTEKSPEISAPNNYPRHKIKYKNNRGHMLNQPTIHIDTENSIVDYESNDTIATQRQLVKMESIIIKQSKANTNLLDSSLSTEDYKDKSIDENAYNTRRLIADTHNLPTHRYDFEMPYVNHDLFPNNRSNIFKNVNANKGPLIPDETNNDKHYKSENIETSHSSPSNVLHDRIDNGCDDTDENEISEKTDSEVLNKNFAENTLTNENGVTDLVKSRMMLFNHPRVCYACNSIIDQSCWSPNRITMVKYCRRDHHACLTKVYQPRGKPQVIRDCGESCSSFSEVTSGEAYASCTICESDLCNSASVLAIQNIFPIVFVALNTIVKFFKLS